MLTFAQALGDDLGCGLLLGEGELRDELAVYDAGQRPYQSHFAFDVQDFHLAEAGHPGAARRR